MKIEELEHILRHVAHLYAAGGAGGPAKDLQRLVELFEDNGQQSVEEFVRTTDECLQAPVARKTASKNKTDMGVAAAHAQALLEAGIEKVAFAEAMDLIVADKKVRKDEWLAIANLYLNAPSGGTHVFKFKTVNEAKNAIKNAFVERLDGQSKQGIIEKLARWG
jgi:hypothetical protein